MKHIKLDVIIGMSYCPIFESLQLISGRTPVDCTRECLGAVSIRKTVLPGMAIPMLKIRRPNGRLIFNIEITICR